MPVASDLRYAVGYDYTDEKVDFDFGNGCIMDVVLGGGYNGLNSKVRLKQREYGTTSTNHYVITNYTSDEMYNLNIVQTAVDNSDAEFNFSTTTSSTSFNDVVLRLASFASTKGWKTVNITLDTSQDDPLLNIDSNVTVEGVTNSTGGFATDTGSGWSGTFTATEGVVTVRQGIIIDVDWD